MCQVKIGQAILGVKILYEFGQIFNHRDQKIK